MKTIKLFNLLAFVACLSIFSIACSPEDGATGPQGEQGERGQQGDQGDTGTANVIYSDWVDHGFGNQAINQPTASFNIDAPEITNDILNNGAILIYARRTTLEDDGTVSLFYYQLPAFFYGSTQLVFRYSIVPPDTDESAIIRIRMNTLDGSDIVDRINHLTQFRYVVIPRGVTTSGKNSSKKQEIDYTNLSYEEVISLLNIPNN